MQTVVADDSLHRRRLRLLMKLYYIYKIEGM